MMMSAMANTEPFSLLESGTSGSGANGKATYSRRGSSRRAKHRAPVMFPSHRSSLSLQHDRTKMSMQKRRDKAARSTGDIKVAEEEAPHRKVFYVHSTKACLKNETWDEITSSYPITNAPPTFEFGNKTQIQQVSDQSSENSGSSDRSRIKAPLKPSLVSDITPRSMVSKHVNFSTMVLTYSSPNDGIKNTWLDIDVSGAILSARNHGMTVCFGSSTTKAAAEDLMCKDGKGYMVRIQKDRLVKEMLGQRARLRKAVFEEQVRQKQEGILDIDAMEAVASAQSKWGVEVAKSSWFLHNLPK